MKDSLDISIRKARNIISEDLKQETEGDEKDDIDSDGSNSTEEDDIVGELQFHIRLLMSLVPSMEKAFGHAIKEQQQGQMASSIACAMQPTLSRRERNSLRSGRSQEIAQDESAAPVADQPQAAPTTTHEYESLKSIGNLSVRPSETKDSGCSARDLVDQPSQHRRIQDADYLPRATQPAIISHSRILSGENQKGPIPESQSPIEPELRSRAWSGSTPGSGGDVGGSAQDLRRRFQKLLSLERQSILQKYSLVESANVRRTKNRSPSTGDGKPSSGMSKLSLAHSTRFYPPASVPSVKEEPPPYWILRNLPLIPEPPKDAKSLRFRNMLINLSATPIRYENPGLLDEALSVVPVERIYKEAEEEQHLYQAIPESLGGAAKPEWGYQDCVLRSLLRYVLMCCRQPSLMRDSDIHFLWQMVPARIL